MFKKLIKKKVARPIVWVIDDSEIERTLIQCKLTCDDYTIRYFSNAKNIVHEFLLAKLSLRSPACVAVDYFLNDGIDGDKTLKFFKDNGVDTVLMTGYEGEIRGIPKSDIIYKQRDNSHIPVLGEWIKHAI